MNPKQGKCTADLIIAALRIADLAKRHLEHEEKKTALLREAAQDEREGRTAQAQNKRYRVDIMMATTGFDYTGAFKALSAAAQRYRKSADRCPYCNGTPCSCKHCEGLGTLDAACANS